MLLFCLKTTLFFNSLFFINAVCLSQRNGHDLIDPEALSFKELNLTAQKSAPSEIKLPFASIKIMDNRFDTSKIGFLPYIGLVSGKKDIFKKIRFKGGVVKPLENYYNDYYKNSFTSNGFDLLIVMKRFWISGKNTKRSQRIELTNSLDVATNLYCKWEYYLGKEGKYLPLKRIDTIIQVSQATAQFVGEEFDERKMPLFKYALKAMIELNYFEKNVEAFDNQPKKTMEDIVNYNAKRFDLAVLKNINLKKGIYQTFQEFKNNSPSIIDFKEEKIRYQVFKSERYLTDMLGNLIKDYWGYSDGIEFRYGKYGNDKIFRIGNTFQFFVQINNTDANNSTPVATKDKTKVWFPYQIDMETGEIY